MIEPYYQDNLVTIYHGDCAEIVPQLGRFDLLLTDPPYGMSFVSNHRKEKHDKIQGDERLPVEDIEYFISRADCASYVFCRWDNIAQMPKPKSVMAWVKNNWSMGDLKHEHGRQWEACCFYNAERHEFSRRIPDVIYANRTGNDMHPTQKPVSLMAQLIECNIVQSILDPYAGSGTVGVAARSLGIKSTLIEIEEKYCEIARQRVQQRSLFEI
jgi:site-specific DNA-methyltransferase (adenine-specific)